VESEGNDVRIGAAKNLRNNQKVRGGTVKGRKGGETLKNCT
jgi:hypothetical protein